MLPSDSSIQLFRPKEILTFLASTNACFSDLGTQAYNHFFSWPSRQARFVYYFILFFGGPHKLSIPNFCQRKRKLLVIIFFIKVMTSITDLVNFLN
jgi:hypothetical protein